ncbi:MAG: RNA methyltransferase [Chloroflexi bacterium]|nr:MAG: RNA methyltransferase [Chloroflexota bacterium]
MATVARLSSIASVVITSTQNPRVKGLLALRRRPDRDREGLLLVEGHDELAVALASGARPVELYHCPALTRQPDAPELLARTAAAGAHLVEVSQPVFERVAYRQAPDGWLAVLPAVPTGLDHLRVPPGGAVLVCESVEKPGNLGAMLRTADAAGLDAVIACPAATDWGNPNVVRASKGALFTVPVAEAGHDELVAWLRERDLAVVIARPDAATPFTAADLTGGVALVVGAEHQGLSAAWSRAADAEVRIPMFGSVNSLNVAASAALLVYELLRQRGRLG